jgi:hypothetical protein
MEGKSGPARRGILLILTAGLRPKHQPPLISLAFEDIVARQSEMLVT